MTKKKILVVDDTEFNRDLVVQLLEDEFKLIIAEDGALRIELKVEDRAVPPGADGETAQPQVLLLSNEFAFVD